MRLKHLVCSLSLAWLLLGGFAACGTPSLTTVPSTTPPRSTSSVTAPPAASSVVVSLGQVASHQAVGSTFTVLTTGTGFTLYIHEWQGTSGFTCDGPCARTWTPLVYRGTGTPASTTPLPGKLSVGTDAQGRRIVFYQGYPLYTYVGDTKPGDFNALLADNAPWQPAVLDIPTGW